MRRVKCPGCENGFAAVGVWQSGLPRLVPCLACNMTGFVQRSESEQWRADIRERAVKPPCFELRRGTLRHEVTAEMDRIAERTIARLEGAIVSGGNKATVAQRVVDSLLRCASADQCSALAQSLILVDIIQASGDRRSEACSGDELRNGNE